MIGIVTAMANHRRPTGRVTPKGTRPADRTTARSEARSAAASSTPPPAQVGRRPSRPSFLLAVAVAWLVVAVVILTTFSAGWRFIPGVFAIGIGLFFARAAAATVVRR